MDHDSILPGPVVSGVWLRDHIDQVAVADVRWSVANGPNRDGFVSEHIPGAVFVDLDHDLSDRPGDRGRHPLPTAGAFEAVLNRLGIAGRPIVCYDDASGATAARMWWMLRAIGRPAAVLDGGIEAWPGTWESGPSKHHDTSLASDSGIKANDLIDEWPASGLITADEVTDAINSGLVLLDARSRERFAGEPNPVDSPAGHIPGARSRPWTDNVGDDGRLLDADELRRQFDELGVDSATGWAASCGSGVTACHNLLAAAVAGLPTGRLYAGSWSEWSRDPERPVATGASS